MGKIAEMNAANCKKEQVIAYNFLFRDAHINEVPLEKIIPNIERFYGEKLRTKKLDVALIQRYVSGSYESYMQRPFMAGRYDEIAQKIILDN